MLLALSISAVYIKTQKETTNNSTALSFVLVYINPKALEKKYLEEENRSGIEGTRFFPKELQINNCG